MAFFLRHWRDYGRHTLKKNKAYLAGLDRATVAEIGVSFVRIELVQRLRPAVVQRMEQHRRAGDVIALLTGTPDFIAAPLAEWVGAEVWRATRCAQRGGRFITAPPEVHPFADDKVRHALEVCAAAGVKISSSTAYADEVYDLPLLRRVGRPVAVNPDRGLARVARREGWEVLPGTRAAKTEVLKPATGRVARG
jgi:phosphoserine phosphatase